MSLLGRSLTLGFFWPIIINFLADLYHFFNIVIRHWLWSLVLSYRSIWCSVSVWIIYENLSFDSTFGTIARCTSSCLWFNHSFIYLGFRNLCCCRCIRWKLLLSRVICCWILFHPTTSFWLLIHFQLLNIWIIVSWVNDSRVLSNKSSTVIQVFKSVLFSRNPVSCCRFGLGNVLQVWILHYQVLESTRSIIDWWSLVCKTSLHKFLVMTNVR